MDGAFPCNFEQPRSLFIRQGPRQFDLAVNVIDESYFRIASSAIFRAACKVSGGVLGLSCNLKSG